MDSSNRIESYSQTRLMSSTITPGGGSTPYNGLYGEAPPERGTFFTLQVKKKGRDFTS